MKTIPQIKDDMEEAIWSTIRELLVQNIEQKDIAVKLDVSPSWLSRWMNKNANRIKEDREIPRWAYRAGYTW